MTAAMDWRPAERPLNHHPPPPNYPPPFAQQTAQPPVQIPFSDPFSASRDPFLPHGRRGSLGPPGRAWPPTPGLGNSIPPPSQHASHLSALGPPYPPPPNGLVHMPMQFDPTRRRSLGGAGSPPQMVAGPLEPPPPPPPPTFFSSRNMPPPSSPQMPPPTAPAHLASAPRGPPISSPFAGVRDLAGFASHRPPPSMPIASILGGGDERRLNSSPNTIAAGPISTRKPMQPLSPGRARASSMREGVGRREPSPLRDGVFGGSRAQSAFHDRSDLDARREVFTSPRFPRESPHSFRAFRPEQQESRVPLNGNGMIGRPNSQPLELAPPRDIDEALARRELPIDGRYGAFRHFGEPERIPRHDMHAYSNGVTSQPREHDVYGSPNLDRDGRQVPARFQQGSFGTPMAEQQAGLFRPAYQYGPDAARESIEARPMHELRRDEPRSSPPIAELPPYMRARNGFVERPLTLEEHQRMEAFRGEQPRKESDGSLHRALLGISPDLNRKGRNSPLPQAVQGAQPRHIGPGGDHPGIKMEFGRMFSGLGSGVGSATPTAGQSMNGMTTPSRLSPARHLQDGDLVRTAVAGIGDGKASSKPKGSKRGGRRSRDNEKLDMDGRATPDLQRGNKRSRTTHPSHHHHHHLHSHHHHHHHHDPVDGQAGSFNMLRFPSNPGVVAPPAHHHHHHATHAHPAHHHHRHTPKPASIPRKPSVTVSNQKVLKEAAAKPRHHLGSCVYEVALTQMSPSELARDPQIKFSTKMQTIPLLEGRENCTYTIRAPRYYLTQSHDAEAGDEPSLLAAICERRQLWGTDIYTDDSDVIAAAIHSGWLKGDFGELNNDLRDVDGEDSEADNPGISDHAASPFVLSARPTKPIKIPPDCDMHITVLILPPLETYASTMQHHIRSREWAQTKHDGMSFMIHGVEFVDESEDNRFIERGIKARKERLVKEELRRREAATGLLNLFANGQSGSVTVGA
ncbi:hypothetical protein BAUCODRAFT_35326 [Baudoinia panamericana UAMH 10762]|uniref:Rxt3-domain-containing protein n=1 Tax=Baudoinia panamericana (strain UAMH 10762) TaxID=717646 RepID=M2LLZ4_BAUPA|nr:uncharacterized protein BAUCODRAFT_35326 [Baudoinia panamericana UAMH 10762]EMC95342.1 hypothetical protein BAUCODRAFT_35326 [Baudoinia panamericana UAMH 10762]